MLGADHSACNGTRSASAFSLPAPPNFKAR
jgi:hypothetical protein